MGKRPVLRQGDKVGVIAPGALFNREKFQTGVRTLKSWGLVPVLDKNLFKKDFIFAGTVRQRYEGIRRFLENEEIKALWCVRGGYGGTAVAQLLSRLRPHSPPKIMIGLSDVTALHLVFNQIYKWPSIHGPTLDRMGIKDQPERERLAVKRLLFEGASRWELCSGLKPLGGKSSAQGLLVGGNLSLLCTSIGSPWEVDTKNKILFFEEIGEPPYRIDRMIEQLRNAGKFEKVRGLVLGDFTECRDRDGRETWKTVLKRQFDGSPFPVLTGVKSGHGPLRLPLPLGDKVKISTRGTPFFKVADPT